MLLFPLLYVSAQETLLQDSVRMETTEQLEIFQVDTAGVTDLVNEQAKKQAKTKKRSNFQPNPTKALLWAIVPSGGQIYNRKYWKIPIVYAGAAALTYAIWWNGSYYNKYLKAYVSLADDDPSTNFFVEMLPTGQTAETVDRTWFLSALNTKQLNYRRNRDLAIIGAVAFYGLTFLDAYVDAQLYDFDISPDLSLRIKPSFTTDTNPALGVSCQLRF